MLLFEENIRGSRKTTNPLRSEPRARTSFAQIEMLSNGRFSPSWIFRELE